MSKIIKSPICIASPVRRSGTTLIQRLLSSASNGLIYGENCANDFMMQVNLLNSKQAFMLPSKDWRNEQLQSVLDGDVNNWIPDLMPDIDSYLLGYQGLVAALAKNYGGFAKEKGRSVWGMKLPEWHPQNLKAVQDALPGTKIIYLHRNLLDCVRSARKIEMVLDLNEIHRFCQTWQQYKYMANEQLNGDDVLHLNYEELVENPEQTINEIEQFTGAIAIDRNVMDVKVNTYNNDQRLEKEHFTYLKPSTLTKEEMDLVRQFQK